MGKLRRTSRKALSRLRGGPSDPGKGIPGPSSDPASNLVMADVTMRIGSYLMRRLVERRFLKGRYGKENARAIVRNRGIGQQLASVAIARVATGSLPGAALISTGMAVKMLLDRSKKRRKAKAEGDDELLDQARGE